MRHICCAADEVEPGEMVRATLPDGTVIAIYNVDGTFFATDDLCTHGAASLSEDGTLDGFTIECSWHFGSFDIRTGAPTASPCTEPLGTFPVQIEDGQVWVVIEDAGSGAERAAN